ncbi:MAG: efflux RND transporter periplasmic adaptor subunit [Hyphomonadaceae bacterium]
MAACGAGETQRAPAPEGPLVEVVAVAPVAGPGVVRASGLVQYRREPALAFTSPGVITAINVDSGDVVRRGQRLAAQRRTSVGGNAQEAALARENAERDLARTQDLYERGFVSEARLEAARLAVERARETTVLTAPTDGVILRRTAEPSQIVAAGAPVLILGETGSGIVVRASMSSAQAQRIRVGQSATVRVADEGEAGRVGEVTRVAAKGDDRTGAFEVEVEVGSGEGLRSGMVAEVEVAAGQADSAQEALLVPTLALLDARADQGVVYVVDERGVARRRAVRTAGVSQAGVMVIEGLQAGERIVSAGAAYVRDGEAVRVRSDADG